LEWIYRWYQPLAIACKVPADMTGLAFPVRLRPRSALFSFSIVIEADAPHMDQC
jgi:hypothetical protein